LEQLVLKLGKLALTAWSQEVLLARHVLLCGLLWRLRQILLAKAKQALRSALQWRELLLRLLGLCQALSSQAQESILVGFHAWVERVASTSHTAVRAVLEVGLTKACGDAYWAKPRFFSRDSRRLCLGSSLGSGGFFSGLTLKIPAK
jgi:hypothetical protein